MSFSLSYDVDGKLKIKKSIEKFINYFYLDVFKDILNIEIDDNLLKTIYNEYIEDKKIDDFIELKKNIKEKIEKDLEFYMISDPALTSKEELILSYPGLFAILSYRLANLLYKMDIKIIPRMITEYAHSLTGIDIHPASTLGCPVFIDHGTGIVIGETSKVGDFVKIYHGVTLGASNIKNALDLKGVKRHPTIGNNVTIYANTSILGGKTVVGDNSVVGSNLCIAQTIENDSLIYQKDNVLIKKKINKMLDIS